MAKKTTKSATKKVAKEAVKAIHHEELYRDKLKQSTLATMGMQQLQNRFNELKKLQEGLREGLDTIRKLYPDMDFVGIADEVKAEIEKEMAEAQKKAQPKVEKKVKPKKEEKK